MNLKCVIIDDEPLARECIANYVRELDFLTLVGEGNNPLELIKIEDKHQIDLVFLDIQMPVMNGITYLEQTKSRPMVILTTAYPNYALAGFEFDVVDYLLKPITFNRFCKAVTKAKQLQQFASDHNKKDTAPQNSSADYFFIKSDRNYEKIILDQVLYIEAMQNYVSFHMMNEKKHMALFSLKSVEEKLKNTSFIRVHKSYIVAADKIDSIADNKLKLGSVQIPIGRNYKEVITKEVLGNKILKK
ncbi:LytR/AlgR family response regulator transcription factor [Spongiivirga citrea]|uniref:Response regulator n=1 Tax=Spongiivirga citrea TaxID=1481457 RepID=A0A6M0CKF3_9FLAO|nr:LytTR family DNA-binding domain-containing protein [Spongiivirga citrea]NER18445.1 response regulator [Spongiivirga citrea]